MHEDSNRNSVGLEADLKPCECPKVEDGGQSEVQILHLTVIDATDVRYPGLEITDHMMDDSTWRKQAEYGDVDRTPSQPLIIHRVLFWRIEQP